MSSQIRGDKFGALAVGVLLSVILGGGIFWQAFRWEMPPTSNPSKEGVLEKPIIRLGVHQKDEFSMELANWMIQEWTSLPSPEFQIQIRPLDVNPGSSQNPQLPPSEGSSSLIPSPTPSAPAPDNFHPETWDVGLFSNEWSHELDVQQLVHPMAEFADLSRFHPVSSEALAQEGSYLGMPITMGGHLVLFSRANIENYDNFSLSDLLLDVPVPQEQVTPNPSSARKWQMDFQTAQLLFSLLDAEQKWPFEIKNDESFEVQLSLDSLDPVWKLLHQLRFSTQDPQFLCTGSCAAKALVDGKMDYWLAPENYTRELLKQGLTSLRVYPLPRKSVGMAKLNGLVSGLSAFVSSKTPLEKEVYIRNFLSFIASRKSQLSMALKFHIIPAMHEAQFDESLQTSEVMVGLLSSLGSIRPAPTHTKYRDLSQALVKAFWSQKELSREALPTSASPLPPILSWVQSWQGSNPSHP